MEARDIQTEFVGPIGKDDGKRYKTQTLADKHFSTYYF